jgi:hypothetical protein
MISPCCLCFYMFQLSNFCYEITLLFLCVHLIIFVFYVVRDISEASRWLFLPRTFSSIPRKKYPLQKRALGTKYILPPPLQHLFETFSYPTYMERATWGTCAETRVGHQTKSSLNFERKLWNYSKIVRTIVQYWITWGPVIASLVVTCVHARDWAF